jgi:hypothetical protein
MLVQRHVAAAIIERTHMTSEKIAGATNGSLLEERTTV